MLELVLEYRNEAQNIASWAVCLAALLWGGGPERLIALVWLALFKGLDAAYHALFDTAFRLNDIDVFHAMNDLFAGAAFIVIALNANRMYPLWIAAFQLITVAAHLARDMVEAMTPIAYAVMAFGPAYFQVIIFGAGLVLHHRRVKSYGNYRDWRVGAPDILQTIGSWSPAPRLARS